MLSQAAQPAAGSSTAPANGAVAAAEAAAPFTGDVLYVSGARTTPASLRLCLQPLYCQKGLQGGGGMGTCT